VKEIHATTLAASVSSNGTAMPAYICVEIRR